MTKTNTVEPRYNEPLYNEILGTTKNFLYSSNSMEKNLDLMSPRVSEQILPVPWPVVISRFHCIVWSGNQTVVKSCISLYLFYVKT